jgi:hypothetical protein
MQTTDLTPHAMLAGLDKLLAQLITSPNMQQGDKATCVLLRLDVSRLREKYAPTLARVSKSQQFSMSPGAPEAEQQALLGQ